MMTFGFSRSAIGFQLVVVDHFGVAAHAVKRGPVELAAEAQFVAVGQMAAVSQVESQNGVARLQHGRIRRGIGLGAGVRLHVGVLGAEDFRRARAPGSPPRR